MVITNTAMVMIIESHSHRHGKEVDKHLIQYLSHLTCDNTDNSIFISLSGNTLDLGWLCDLEYSVVGAEISEIGRFQIKSSQIIMANSELEFWLVLS